MKRVFLLSVVFALCGYFSGANAQITILSGFQGATYFEMSKDLEKIAPPHLIENPEEHSKTIVDPNDPTSQIDSTWVTISYDTVPFIKVLPSDGAYYNFLKLEKTDVDVTFLQYDVLLYEELRDLTRKFKRTANIRILLPMGSEQIHLIARKDSKIGKLSDLKGKQIGIGSSMQGTNITAKYIKEKTGINWRDVEIPYDRAFRALLIGDIDAFFFVGAAPVSSLNRLSPNLKDQIKLIPIEHDKLKDAYEVAKITSGEYSWLDKEVTTYSVKTVLVCSENTEKAADIDKLLQIIKNNLGTLQDPKKAHPQWQNVVFSMEGIDWDFFPAAKKYMQ